MIYTCTTNPSLDYYISLNKLKPGINNRNDSETFGAGGKGVNVSIVLNNFHIQSSCLGFLGGFTKDFYLSFFKSYPNIQPLFTTIKENTRINIKLMEDKQETGLNAIGPHIADEEFEKFKKRLLNIYNDDYFVLSGSIQDEIEDRMCDIINELIHDNVKVILDTEPQLVDRLVDLKPFMVKLNDVYLDYKKMNLDEIAKNFIEKGIKYVFYSSVGKDSYLYSKDCKLMCKNMTDGLVNTTGSSDSMVAGFIYGLIKGADAMESFKYANAACISTSMTNDLDSKDRIEKAFDTIEVQSL